MNYFYFKSTLAEHCIFKIVCLKFALVFILSTFNLSSLTCSSTPENLTESSTLCHEIVLNPILPSNADKQLGGGHIVTSCSLLSLDHLQNGSYVLTINSIVGNEVTLQEKIGSSIKEVHKFEIIGSNRLGFSVKLTDERKSDYYIYNNNVEEQSLSITLYEQDSFIEQRLESNFVIAMLSVLIILIVILTFGSSIYYGQKSHLLVAAFLMIQLSLCHLFFQGSYFIEVELFEMSRLQLSALCIIVAQAFLILWFLVHFQFFVEKKNISLQNQLQSIKQNLSDSFLEGVKHQRQFTSILLLKKVNDIIFDLKQKQEQNTKLKGFEIQKIDQLCKFVRDTAHQLHPHTLSRYGLNKALEQQIFNLESCYPQIEINFNSNVHSEDVDVETSEVIYYSFLDLISKIDFIENSRRIDINLNLSGIEFTLRVRDYKQFSPIISGSNKNIFTQLTNNFTLLKRLIAYKLNAKFRLLEIKINSTGGNSPIFNQIA